MKGASCNIVFFPSNRLSEGKKYCRHCRVVKGKKEDVLFILAFDSVSAESRAHI